VTEPEDVLEVLAPMLREGSSTGAEPPDGTGGAPIEVGHGSSDLPAVGDADKARLLGALGPAPVDIDELARATGLPIRSIRIALIELDLAGRIERHGHQLVSLASGPSDPA
jgi:DNA processing protein